MLFADLIATLGIGTPLHILEDGSPGDEYMLSATICDVDILDPEFQQMFARFKDYRVDTISLYNGRLMVIVKK